MSTPTLLDIKQVAAILGLSVGAAYRRHQRGQLPQPLRLGRSLRWTESAIVNLIENKESTNMSTNTANPLPTRSPRGDVRDLIANRAFSRNKWCLEDWGAEGEMYICPASGKAYTLSEIAEASALPPRSPDSRVMSPAEMSSLFATCGAVYAEPAPLSEEDRRKCEDPDYIGNLRGVDIYSR